MGLQNEFELLRILNYWSLNYRGSTVLSTQKADSADDNLIFFLDLIHTRTVQI